MQYPIFIHKDPDSDFGVTIPDLPGCFSAGNTIENATKSFDKLCEALVTNLRKEVREVSAAKLLDTEDENMRLKKRIQDLEKVLRSTMNIEIDEAIARAHSECDSALLGVTHGNGS